MDRERKIRAKAFPPAVLMAACLVQAIADLLSDQFSKV